MKLRQGLPRPSHCGLLLLAIVSFFCTLEAMSNTSSSLNETTTAAAMFAGRTNASLPRRGMVAKTVVSTEMRLMFFMGLEGTGHHFMADVLGHLFGTNKDLRYFNLCPIARVMYIFNSMGIDPKHFGESQEKIVTEMKKLALAQKELSWPGTIATLQPTKPKEQLGCAGIGTMSYPFNVGRDKVLQYADVRAVTEAAEAEGVDLRIVYLKRSARDLLVANTVHRNLPSGLGGGAGRRKKPKPVAMFMYYAEVMLTSIAVVQSMLLELDPHFVVCHDYDQILSPSHAARISSHVAPNDAVAEMFTRSLLAVAAPHDRGPGDKLGFKDADLITRRLQAKLDALEESLCETGS